MKIEQAQIEKIRTAFQNMQSREDLLHLLNEAKPLVYGEKTVPFQLKQLTWYSNPKLAKNRYTEFKIKKKSGSERTIHAPVQGLKSIQKTLSFVLQCVYEPHHAATGFVQGKSIVDNAKVHAHSNYVYNIDLKDFFSSIDQARVWKCLQLKPFNLIDTKEIIDLKVSKNATIYPAYLRDYAINESINDIILKFDYEGYRYSDGSYNLKLKDGGNVFYQIQKFSNKDFDGIITVFKKKSSFEMIRQIANDTAVERDLDPELALKIWLINFIKFHQDKLNERNTRLRLANIIASICCVKSDGKRLNKKTGEEEFLYVLPQGAPTSPVLSNIICQRMDYLLSAVANRFGLKYSRYADDITFSSIHNVYQPGSDFLKELHRIIAEQGFRIKESKTRLQKEGYRQEVTGLLVNERVNVQKRYIKQLRMWLYYWETYGYERAYNFFLQQYISDRGINVKGKPDMANVIDGKLNYLKMVKGEENQLYVKLKGRFDKLTAKQSFISKVLDIWQENGIESAMDLYYSKYAEKSTDNYNDDIQTTWLNVDDFLDNQLI